jgi:hypothetical protein
LGDNPHFDFGLGLEQRQDVVEQASVLGRRGRSDDDVAVLRRRRSGANRMTMAAAVGTFRRVKDAINQRRADQTLYQATVLRSFAGICPNLHNGNGIGTLEQPLGKRARCDPISRDFLNG